MVTYTEISPKMVNPRDIAGTQVKKKKRKKKVQVKKGFILFWISFRFFKLSELESHDKNREGPRRDISKQSVNRTALSINPSCLKVRLKMNSKGSGDVRLSFKVE